MKRFQNKITEKGTSLPVTFIIALFLWYIGIVTGKESTGPHFSYIFNLLRWNWAESNSYIIDGIGFLFSVIITFMVLEFHNTFSIIRIRTNIVGVIFLWYMGCCTFLHSIQTGTILQLCFIVSLYCLFASYQHTYAVKSICFAFFFCGLGSLFFPKLLYLIPLLLLGMLSFQSFSLRTFFAGLIGLLIPYLFLASYLLYTQDLYRLYIPFQNLITFSPIDYSVLSIDRIAAFCLIALITIVSAVHYFLNSFQDKIRIRSYFLYLYTIDLIIGLSILLQPVVFDELFSIFLLINCITNAHLFALTHSKVSNLFFIICIILSLIIALFNLWKPFMNF